jgi:hypothetical protein
MDQRVSNFMEGIRYNLEARNSPGIWVSISMKMFVGEY